MNTSNNEQYIPWFNPREMADNTVMALATGREELLSDFISVVSRRLESPVKPAAGAHWLVTGQRGAGKSFFLRYAQIRVPKEFQDGRVRFVLLPEELRNVRAPHDLLDEIRRMLEAAHGDHGRPAMWRTENPENSWKESLEKLLAAFAEPLLIVGIENFAQLFDKVFIDDVAVSLLRKLMEHEARILILATAVDGSFDDDYGNRFYHQFEKRPLPGWDSQAHRRYLQERANLTGRSLTPEQLARIDAYSRYTGGNARIAAILAAAILDEQDIVEAGSDLNAAIDRISDYYRALLDALPKNSEILFDALIRGGEPCSQTQLAERVGARQSDISQAFARLLEIGYLNANRPRGQKETRYQVADRLFAEWYRMRYLDPGQRSRLAVMADLLVDIITFREKLSYVERFTTRGEHDNAQYIAELAYRERGIDVKPLRAAGIDLIDWARRMKIDGEGREDWLDLMEMFPSDEDMRKALDEATTLARNCTRIFDGEAYSGEILADLVWGGLRFGILLKLVNLRGIPFFSRSVWDKTVKYFEDRKQEFAKIADSDEEYIQKLIKWRDSEWQHPWLYGWRNIRSWGLKIEYKQWSETDLDIIKTAICAVEWLHRFRKGDELASRTFNELLNFMYIKKVKHGWWDELLQICKRLLDALPYKVDCARERTLLLARQSGLFSHFNREEQALQSAQEALALIADQTASKELNEVRGLASRRAGWALGMLNRWSEALAIHQGILPLLTSDKAMAWPTGQTARYLWRIKGLASAWQLIASQNLEDDDLAFCIGQLGDGVCDTQRVDGIPQAYAAGRELLTSLIERASNSAWKDNLFLEKSVHYVFINMLDTGLDLTVLQDLAKDLPGFAPAADKLKPMAETLYRWFGELRNHGNADKNASPPDPDWTATVAALNEGLSLEARLRLGLAETPRLSPEAAGVFMRILAFIK